MNGYQNFLTLLTELEIQLKPDVAQDLPNQVKTLWQKAYQYFQANLENYPDSEIESEGYYRWTSLRTEITREVRLLNTEILFWQSSRHSQTQFLKQTKCWQSSQKLIKYCQMILELLSRSSNS